MPIAPHVERIFLSEIFEQVRFAALTIEQFNDALKAGNVTEMFRLLDDFLGHCGRISLLLWPQDQRSQERGRLLRERLQVAEDEVLKDRRLRNHLEHIDERLDRWAVTTVHNNFVDRIVGPRGAIGGPNIQPTDIIRHYVPNEKTYIFMSEEFNIADIAASVGKLLGTFERLFPSPIAEA